MGNRQSPDISSGPSPSSMPVLPQNVNLPYGPSLSLGTGQRYPENTGFGLSSNQSQLTESYSKATGVQREMSSLAGQSVSASGAGHGIMTSFGEDIASLAPLDGRSMVHPSSVPQTPQLRLTTDGFGGYGERRHLSPQQQQQHQLHGTFARDCPNESPTASYLSQSPLSGSPGWLPVASPSSESQRSLPSVQRPLRYPVLNPLVPSIKTFVPTSTACDLLDVYFASLDCTSLHPMSPYLLGYVFRKNSILHPTRPRRCSSALLASMLWIAAQSSDAPFVACRPDTRSRICQRLLNLTIRLLQPSAPEGRSGRSPSTQTSRNLAIGFSNLDGFHFQPPDIVDDSLLQHNASVDDVATYVHLATGLSSLEYNRASLRWWEGAWSLARALKLSREMPSGMPFPDPKDHNLGGDIDAEGEADIEVGASGYMTRTKNIRSRAAFTWIEEEREERRRLWWLLYTVDRHLALCYNRTPFLSDAECSDLRQPVDERTWQSGESYYGPSTNTFSETGSAQSHCHRGPSYECTSQSIFGFFTPLMTILGQIIELRQARRDPNLGLSMRHTTECERRAMLIAQQLDAYQHSLGQLQDHTTYGGAGQNISLTELGLTAGTQGKRSIAYGTYFRHVLHILLICEWDPVSLLDSSDVWVSSESFFKAAQHAINAAEALWHILDCDPALSFTPFFLGVYLFQGSNPLLLVADRARGEANPSIVRACQAGCTAVEGIEANFGADYLVRKVRGVVTVNHTNSGSEKPTSCATFCACTIARPDWKRLWTATKA